MFIKICGITEEPDALLAVALGADALGFVFASGSPRQVSPDDVRDIVRRLPAGTQTIGVFRDERPARVVEIVQRIGLSGAQLHGREPASEVKWIRERLPFVIQAFPVGDPALGVPTAADVVLLDSIDPGSGRVFDWALAEGAPSGVRILLAGGLNPKNVVEAIHRVRPWGVDVSTGVETEPGSGRKDARKLAHFIEVVRSVIDNDNDTWRPVDPPPFDWAPFAEPDD